MYERYRLGDDKAREMHNRIINIDTGYSLTLTLNPRFNCLPVNEQYRKFSREIKQLFEEIETYFNTLMISYEFTKDYNIHAHVYFDTSVEDIQLFEQNFKKQKQKYISIGKNYMLKKIDEISDELKNYPFKDIERTLKYSKLENVLFNPYHYVIRSNNMGSLRSPMVAKCGNIDIMKFINYVNSNKNI